MSASPHDPTSHDAETVRQSDVSLRAMFLGRVAYQHWRNMQPFPEWLKHWEKLDAITQCEWVILASSIIDQHEKFKPFRAILVAFPGAAPAVEKSQPSQAEKAGEAKS